MDRRSFCKLGLGSLASAGGAWALSGVAVGGEKAPAGEVGEGKAPAGAPRTPDELSAAAMRHFMPGGKTCSEAMVSAGCEALKIRATHAADLALGLAAGVGLQGDVCGAVTGSAMILGLAVGRKESDYKAKRMKTLFAVGKLYRRFRQKHGTVDCRKLCGLDLTTEAGRKALLGGVKATKCAKLIDAGARMLAEALAELDADA